MDAVVPGFGVRVTDKTGSDGKAAQRTFILVTRYPGSTNPTRSGKPIGNGHGPPPDRERAAEAIADDDRLNLTTPVGSVKPHAPCDRSTTLRRSTTAASRGRPPGLFAVPFAVYIDGSLPDHVELGFLSVLRADGRKTRSTHARLRFLRDEPRRVTSRQEGTST